MTAESSARERTGDRSTLLPTVTTPKGGGAIRSIGEKFSTQPATGSGSLSIPIATSPSRGAAVELELRYDSLAGNSPFGVGWRLSIPSIARKTDRGLPRYVDEGEADTFVLAGAEDLVPVRTSDGRLAFADRGQHRVQRFRPRVESSFARIERWIERSSGDMHWRTFTRDNILNIYGRAPAARIVDPEDPARVFTWLLEETRDDRGNALCYHYKAEDDAGVDPADVAEAHRWIGAGGDRRFAATAQRYPKRIRYGNRTPLARDQSVPTAAAEWLFEVVFDYGEHDAASPTPDEERAWGVRRDPFSSYRATFEVRTYRRCTRILMFHRFAELGVTPCLVRSTDLDYDDARVRSADGRFDAGPALSYLATVTHAGYRRDATGEYERAPLPPLALRYAQAIVHDELRSTKGAEGISAGVDGLRARWIDLDGEGLPGVLAQSERAWHYSANLGDGVLGAATLQRALPVPSELRGGAHHLADLGADGNLDLVHYGALTGYFERTTDRAWAPFVPLRDMPVLDWDDPNLRIVDLDGDGLPDVLVTENEAVVWFRSRGKAGFESAESVRKPMTEADGPAVVFADGTESLHLADMSGDGLVDLVRVRPAEICYWPNLGHGRFGRKIVLAGISALAAPDDFDARRVRFADIDGSGTTDLIYLGRAGAQVYFNLSGNALSPPLRLRSLPAVDATADVRAVDVLGNGTSCLVWSSTAPASAGRPLAYVDLMGGRKPHLLESIVNNVGGETQIAYAPSTKFYLQDKREGRPWSTRLPFPVHVLERIVRIDHVARARQVTTFRYHHGYFDGYEREFRGFACVEQWDAESFGPDSSVIELPPARSVTWFHTGAWLDRERIDLALASEFYAGDPAAPVPTRTILPHGLTIREEREALRALRGLVVRQEIYADDGTDAAAHPYSVSHRDYEVRVEQRGHGTNAVVFVHPRHTTNALYERAPADPRIQHDVVLRVDEYGNITRNARLVYPRRAPAHPEQAQLHALVFEQRFANRVDEADWYRVGVSTEATEHELAGVPLAPGSVVAIGEIESSFGGAAERPYEAKLDATSGAERRMLRRERRFYYAADLSGPLALGDIASHALLHEIRRQVFTPGMLADGFGGLVDATLLTTEGRYQLHDGVWWSPSGRAIFDPARFYAPVEAIDPFGAHHRVTYDAYALLVVDAEDALGNHVTAGHRDAADAIVENGNDYRVLAPVLIMDPNGNRVAVAYDARGMVVASADLGPDGSTGADTLADPTTTFDYDLDRWRVSAQPVVTHVRARERHGSANTRWQEIYAYFDGEGREVLRKTQAAPGPVPELDADGHVVRDPDGSPRFIHAAVRWIGTGRAVFDNKGNVVKKYEPFFSTTFEFEDEASLVEWGVTPIFRRDPLGRLIQTDHPDGTQSRAVIHPWQRDSWDRNDSVAGTPWLARKQAGTPAEQRCAALALAHVATPMIVHLDPWGRVFLTTMDNGAAGRRSTRVELDIEGNARSYTDERGTETARQIFDMIRRPVRIVRAEAGGRDPATGDRMISVADDPGGLRILLDAADKPVRSWDERGFAIRRRYDALQRPTHVGVRAGTASERVVERTIYGEAHPAGAARNLRARPHLIFDGAGVVINEAFDLHGNATRTARRLARDVELGPDWTVLDAAADLAAIESAAASLLEPERFTSTAMHDALNRIVLRATPDGTVARPSYDESGLVAGLEVWLRGLDPASDELRTALLRGGSEDDARWTAVVTDAAYNAHRAPILIAHGNGATAELTYDPETFRLVRQRVERASGVLQDLTYEHDPSGNIVAIADAVAFGNPAVAADAAFAYDALYQLVEAEGREHPGQQPGAGEQGALRLDHPNDLQALRRYRETYDYDAAGNITRMAHATAGGGAWTRAYAYGSDSNRLARTSGPSDPAGTLSLTYDHDDGGNVSAMPHLPSLRWDHDNRLRGARRQAGGGDDVHFAYDASGARVRKVYAHGSVVEERIYLGEYEIYRRRDADAPAPSFERQTLRLVDQQRCIAVVETRTIDIAAPPAPPATRWRYQVTDHLGSSRMELDAAGSVIGYEEFHPYGTCAFRATDAAVEVSARRYRYTCHERDEETGFDRVGMRYYAPWLARWTSPDPAGSVDGLNLYRYVRNNPLRYSDPSGTDSRDSTAGPALHQLRTSGSGSGDPTSSGSVGSRGGATAATTPSIVRTTGPSGGTGGTSGAAARPPLPGGALGVFERIARALGDAARWMREWLPGLIAAPLAGLVDILAGFVRFLGGVFTWNGSVALQGLKDMGTGALSILGLKEVFTESWDRTGGSPGDATTALRLPGSLHQDVRNASARIPADAYKNGMHSWHAATNAAVAHRVGPVGIIPLFLAGVTHESPIDWGSFMAEQDSQGTLNHILDSLMDIVANIFGMLIGLLLPRGWAIEVAAILGNHIPGPGDPNPLGLAGLDLYNAHRKPSRAWGQYPDWRKAPRPATPPATPP